MNNRIVLLALLALMLVIFTVPAFAEKQYGIRIKEYKNLYFGVGTTLIYQDEKKFKDSGLPHEYSTKNSKKAIVSRNMFFGYRYPLNEYIRVGLEFDKYIVNIKFPDGQVKNNNIEWVYSSSGIGFSVYASQRFMNDIVEPYVELVGGPSVYTFDRIVPDYTRNVYTYDVTDTRATMYGKAKLGVNANLFDENLFIGGALMYTYYPFDNSDAIYSRDKSFERKNMPKTFGGLGGMISVGFNFY